MIKTSTSFVTDHKYLQAIYDNAERILLSSVKSFGDRAVAVRRPNAAEMTLNSEVLSAATLAAYAPETAINTVKAFLATQREDGRFADSICCRGEGIFPRYNVLTGFCFAEEALSLYYLTRKKDAEYLDALLTALERFDSYLWQYHDLNFNNCLEVFGAEETEEGVGTNRYSAIRVEHYGEMRDVSPFPIESSDLMACDVAIRRTISRIYSLREDGENAGLWQKKADAVQANLKQMLWVESKGACFDRDYRGSGMDALTVNNLFMMYYGAFDADMAKTFLDRHLRDPQGFFTAFPLPTVAVRDRCFVNSGLPNFNGQSRGMSYRRAIGALERYGFYSYLTDIGEKFLRAVSDGCFAEQFDPFTGEGVCKGDADEYTPTASAALTLLSGFFGIRQQMDRLHWGALGHREGYTSEYSFTWGGDTFRMVAERDISSGFVGDRPLFTVTNGMRVITDLYGNVVRVVNITDQPIDGVLVCKERTYSFSLQSDEAFDLQEPTEAQAEM